MVIGDQDLLILESILIAMERHCFLLRDGNKWPRSFEVGEYPNSNGKNLCLKATRLKDECDMANICHHAQAMTYNILLDCGMTSPNK